MPAKAGRMAFACAPSVMGTSVSNHELQCALAMRNPTCRSMRDASVEDERLRRLLHARGGLVTDAGERREKIPVSHSGTQEGPTHRLVLHLEKLPALIF